MARPRGAVMLTIAVIFLLYRWSFAPSSSDDDLEQDIDPALGGLRSWVPQLDVHEEVEVLQRLALTSKFEYRRTCITTTPNATIQRSSLQDARLAFFKPIEGEMLLSADLGSSSDGQPGGCTAQLHLNVPFFNKSAPVDTSSLMLGMATTLPRLNESLPAMARWLGHTGTALQVLITDHANLDHIKDALDSIRFAAYTMGIDLMIDAHEFPWESDGRKSFALSRFFDWHKRPETRWFGIIDDDTFVNSLPDLVRALDPYDPSRQWYVGALTEGLTRLAREGFKAAAGAGIFLSAPLVSLMVEHYDDCRELDEGYADLLWRDCIIEHTTPTVPLTQLDGLNQIDMWKDVSGFYERFHTQVHTLHHWRSWHYHPVPVAHLVTDVAGPQSFLQRYSFHDDTVLHNGYSLVHYPHGVPDLNLLELTMVEDVGVRDYPHKREFLHKLGRSREVRKLGRTKVQWKFETAVKARDGSVKQFYVKRASTKQGQNIDSVIQIDWTPAVLPETLPAAKKIDLKARKQDGARNV